MVGEQRAHSEHIENPIHKLTIKKMTEQNPSKLEHNIRYVPTS